MLFVCYAQAMETKLELRKKWLAVRLAMPQDVVEYKSQAIVAEVINTVDWMSMQKMHCFLPIIKNNEPDMRELIAYASSHGVELYVTYPPYKMKQGLATMHNTKINSYELTDKVLLDLIIVPMIAFNETTKHRLGYGGGFYDRLLRQQPDAQKIGVCFKEFETQLPVEIHDQSLDRIITA